MKVEKISKIFIKGNFKNCDFIEWTCNHTHLAGYVFVADI